MCAARGLTGTEGVLIPAANKRHLMLRAEVIAAVRGGCSKTQLVDAWEQARRAAERVLDTIQPSQLARTTDRSGTPTTYAQVLLHVTHHNAAHMGQIVWITKLLHPGAFDDLWVKQASR